MQDNIFSYWDYDSLQGKPKRELTTFGAAVVTIGGVIVSLGIAWLILSAAAAFQISSR
jgi:hypothetical protein